MKETQNESCLRNEAALQTTVGDISPISENRSSKQSAQPASHGTGHQVPNSHSGSISPDPSDFVSLLWTILRNDHGNSNHCNLPHGPVLGERCTRIQCFILLQLKHSEALEPKLPAAFVLVAYAIRELNWEWATALVLKLYHGQFNWKACVYPGVLSLILDLLFFKDCCRLYS